MFMGNLVILMSRESISPARTRFVHRLHHPFLDHWIKNQRVTISLS
jgi:hypothetical protein